MTECRIEIIEGQPVRVRGDRPMTDEDCAAFTEVVRAARKMMAETPRHFAPYGSTAALCGAPVPRLIGWDEKRAEYRSILFTAHRGEATCEECWRKITTVAATHENEGSK